MNDERQNFRYFFPECAECKRCFLPGGDDGAEVPPQISEFENGGDGFVEDFIPLRLSPSFVLTSRIYERIF
ncbi:MAG: hypothetical protein LBC38_01395 [Oscillospiraceae bacterium]|jgi:hypothetical protein|nr:hypothetical protein [Oscillospiraceae bacterium]